MFKIGTVRHFFMIGGFGGSWKWNAWVRDVTARLEGGWLIRSE